VLLLSISIAFAVFIPLAAHAEDLLPADKPIAEVIDHYIGKHQQAEKVTPADQATDSNIIRRLTLDLAGRIPTAAEAQAYASSTDENKRTQLVDRLLASPDYAYHHRNELDTLLMGDKRDNAWREYLLKAAQDNRPWDQLFREMMIGNEASEQEKPALAFLKARGKNSEDMTTETSVLFFGVNIACAKCHDHPLVGDWLQDHYYGLNSFFSRTYLTKKNTLAEKYSGAVKFTTTAGEAKQAKFMFLTGSVIEEPKIEKTKEQKKAEDAEVKLQQKDDKAPPAKIPEFSPRAKLVELVLRDGDNRFFSQSIANRIWARLMGRGLVHPLDQMHSENPPSHPELMDWLTRDLVAHNYDLKRLLRGIALSQTYSRASAWNGSGDAPEEEYFALASVRALSPRQYALSLALASSSPQRYPLEMKAEEWAQHRKNFENAANGRASQFEIPKDHFQVGVDEALYFSNNSQVQNEYLQDSADKLVGYLKGISDKKQAITAAFWAIHSRAPEAEETAALEAYLNQRSDRELSALQQAVWALLTSPELRFNY